MKTKGWATVMAAALLGVAGCSAPHVDPSGRYPDAGQGNVPQPSAEKVGASVGTLRVDTVVERWGSNNNESPRVQSRYSVYDERGNLVAGGLWGDSDLPAGRYLVTLRETPGAPQTFWVSVQAGKVTEVDPVRLTDVR